MRIWKRLLGTALCLCAAVCVMSVSASAEGHSNHVNCGVMDCTNTNHGHNAVTGWNELKQADVDADGKLTLEDGKSYYLGGNINTAKAITITGTVNLCLNGKTLNSQYTVIEVKGGATLNICDCHGGGGITNTSKSNYGAINIIVTDGTALNLYSGKISSSAKHTVKLENNYWSNGVPAVFNMYSGEVYNDYSSRDMESCAIGISGTSDSSSEINIFGGSVTSTNNDGIQTWAAENAQTHIAGGTVSGGNAALSVLGNLTLSGSPTLKHTNESGADVRITTTNVAETENDHITVSDDFAPAEETKVSVKKSVDSSGSVVFAAPAESNKSLLSKAQYFVSAKEGYFVESNSDGNLQLTACAITGQPTVENSYTVTANGSDDKVKYQWYSAESGEVPVTSKNASADKFRSNWNDGEWSYGDRAENGDPVSLGAFTLHMNAGDVLKLTEAMRVEGFSLADSNNNPVDPVESSRTSCTYAAPANGEYTLTVTARPESFDENNYHLRPSFKATVTADVPDTALTGQVNAALDTSQLETGSYICKVTWENKTTLNSQTVRYAAASSHVHSWSSEWMHDATRHWHECKNANCDVRENSGKSGYAEHSGGAANCTQQAVCTICGTAYGALDAANHSGALGGWQWNEDKHWKEYSCCHVHADEGSHHWNDGKITTAATCTAAGEKTYTCSVCKGTKTEQIDALGHDWGEWAVTKPATTSAAGEETRTCKRDKSHTETRAIPKLTPAPSGGGSSGGSGSAPAVTVPVSGSGDTVHVSASVSGSTAEVKEIKRTELDKIGTDSAVVIDLSGLNKDVTGVTLSTDTIDSICKTEADGVTIKLPSAELRVDRQTLAAVTEQAVGSKIRLVVEPDSTARSTMTAS